MNATQASAVHDHSAASAIEKTAVVAKRPADGGGPAIDAASIVGPSRLVGVAMKADSGSRQALIAGLHPSAGNRAIQGLLAPTAVQRQLIPPTKPFPTPATPSGPLPGASGPPVPAASETGVETGGQTNFLLSEGTQIDLLPEAFKSLEFTEASISFPLKTAGVPVNISAKSGPLKPNAFLTVNPLVAAVATNVAKPPGTTSAPSPAGGAAIGAGLGSMFGPGGAVLGGIAGYALTRGESGKEREIKGKLIGAGAAIGGTVTHQSELRVAASLPVASFVVDFGATLTLDLSLGLVGRASLDQLDVTIVLKDGKVARAAFSVDAVASLTATAAASGRLHVGFNFLPFLPDSWLPAGGLKADLIDSNIFRLGPASKELASVRLQGELLRESPVRGRGLKLSLVATEILKAALAEGQNPFDLERPRPGALKPGVVPTGTTPQDAIRMTWFKPESKYPEFLKYPSRTDRSGPKTVQVYAKAPKTPNKPYDIEGVGLRLGVDATNWPWPGKYLEKKGEPREGGVANFKYMLTKNGIHVGEGGSLPSAHDIDHVQDLNWGGDDNERNMWPLNAGLNRSAGVNQNRHQEVTWADAPGSPPQKTQVEKVPDGRLFQIEKIV